MIRAIYHHSARELLLFDDRRPDDVVTADVRDAAQLAEAIGEALRVPALAAELSAPSHLARWPRGMRT